MLDPAIARLLKEDRRYPLQAYIFVFEALQYAQEVLGLGTEAESEPTSGTEPELLPDDPGPSGPQEGGPPRHVTGQELCHAIREFALEQFGYMARLVLAKWGLRSTGDFGEIVFNLIRIGKMRKTTRDRREDFDNVYDFDCAFREEFRIVVPPAS